MFEPLANQLREAREKAGLSKQDAAAKIRIDLKFLEAMEEGNFSFLAEVYVKAFLRDYARLLDLDEKAVMKTYQMLKEPAVPSPVDAAEVTSGAENSADETLSDASAASDGSFVDESLERARRADRKKMLISGAAGLLIVIAALLYILVSERSDEVITERPFSEVLEQNKKRFEEPSLPEKDSLAVTVSDSLRMRIRANDTVWVSITPDNAAASEYRLFPGRYIDISAAEKFALHLGNSYAVMIELNGRTVALPPQRARVYKAILTARGVE